MATHSSVLAWRIPGTGEPGGLLSLGSHKVRHDRSDLEAAAFPGGVSRLVFHLPFTPSSVPPAWWALLQLSPLTDPCLFLELQAASCLLWEAHPSSQPGCSAPPMEAPKTPWRPRQVSTRLSRGCMHLLGF